MAHNVYRACQDEGVRRFAVIVSSNHAADYYENLIWSGRMDFVTPDMLPLSDNFYGLGQGCQSYELLGFMFACGKEGPADLGKCAIAHRRPPRDRHRQLRQRSTANAPWPRSLSQRARPSATGNQEH